MVSAVRVAVALLLGVTVLAGVAVGTESADGNADRRVTIPPNVTGLDADSRTIQIAVQPDGTAVWEVEYRVALESENATERFESVERRVDREPLAYAGPFAQLMGDVAAAAASETGRDMTVRNVSVRALRLPTGEGVLLYRFEWTNFAATPGNRIEVGDTLVGFDVENDSALFVQWPSGYSAERVTPTPDERRDRTVVWEGPVRFGPGEPRVVVTGGLLRLVPRGPVALVGAVALVALAGVAWRRGGGPLSRVRPGATDGAASDAATGTGAGSDETGDQAVPPELLSDEERVLGLLEASGGRVKQQDIVDELEWSETKTSQVVNDLQDAGKVEVYRIGRENVVSLPGEMDV